MSVEGNYLSAGDELSDAERKVISYVLKHREQAVGMSVAALAKAAGASAASVSRAARRLHFAGFNEMKMQLVADLQGSAEDGEQIEEIHKNEHINSIKATLLANAKRSLAETVDQVNEQDVETVINLIHQSSQILVFGVGASYLVAQDIAQKWARLGYTCKCSDDLNLFLPLAVTSKPKRLLVWLISNSGESPEVLMAAKLAKKVGLTVISTTKLGTNSLSSAADVPLQTSQPLEGRNRLAATQSLHAQFMLVDILYYAFVSRYFDETSERILRSKAAVTEYKESLRAGIK